MEKTWEGTKVVAPPPSPRARARAFPLHHAQTFLAKVKTKSKLKISNSRVLRFVTILGLSLFFKHCHPFSDVSYFWELFKKPIGTDEANTLELL